METALRFQASGKPNLSAYCKEIRAFTLTRRGKILLTGAFNFKMSLSSSSNLNLV